MTDSIPDKPGIPIEDIIEYQNEQAIELDKDKKKLADLKAGYPESTDHPSIVFLEGKISGREEEINSFSAFVIAHSADQTGQLNPDLAGQTDSN